VPICQSAARRITIRLASQRRIAAYELLVSRYPAEELRKM
jgi:hypothetical protein